MPDGATLQLGIGRLADAVAHALKDRQGLRIRSGMVGDWFPELVAAGAIGVGTQDACLASLAVGSHSLYRSLSRDSLLGFALPAELVVPISGSPFMAINSGIEVDLRGQVNAEFLGERYIGAASGQPDYFRAARRSAGGLAILALPSSNERGDISRIVQRIACGYVTSAQSDVDVIVTEHGIADIRGTDFVERRMLIANIANPRARESLHQTVAEIPASWAMPYAHNQGRFPVLRAKRSCQVVLDANWMPDAADAGLADFSTASARPTLAVIEDKPEFDSRVNLEFAAGSTSSIQDVRHAPIAPTICQHWY